MQPDDIYYSDTRGRNLFGYRVEDDSMEPVFRRGDIAVVNPNLPGRPGDYVLARCGEETVLRRLGAGGKRLESLERNKPVMRLAASNILGRVVEKKRIYR
jgi:phage repressor protein C with HTH and peptisase S24 domain